MARKRNLEYKKRDNARRRLRRRHKMVECAVCSAKSNLQRHHIDYDAYNNRLDNIQVLCREHHLWLHQCGEPYA